MRTYTVQAGDSPAIIASRDDMAGCPRCSIDLILENPEKATITYPNGFVTFKDLHIGEVLKIPEKWFDGRHDALPPLYFQALPNADGVTGGALGDDAVTSAAQAAAGAMFDDPSYCQSVARVGSAVNTAVHNFKLAWNASRSPAVPINTGNYEAPTAAAIQAVLGVAPPACAGRAAPSPPPPQQQPLTPPAPSPAPDEGLSTGAVVGIGLLAATAVGLGVYVATRKPAYRAAPYQTLPPKREHKALPAHTREARRRR